ncbi:MAG: gamma-glutamyltransferase [Pseudomonadota bacterium]|nr:gamma-glutamyltransferase [Pseudomonadota bacterium]
MQFIEFAKTRVALAAATYCSEGNLFDDTFCTRRESTSEWLDRVLTVNTPSFLCFLIACVGTLHLGATDTVYGESGMVVSRSQIASNVGLETLKQGGNAVDAAIATAFTLAVTHPSAGNLGGGGFMVICLADGTQIVNDHREKAPIDASRDMYLDAKGDIVPGLSRNTHKAVGVPGSVDGLLSALERYGSLPRASVLARAIELARDGFPLPADIARQFAQRSERLGRFPAGRATFLKSDGSKYVAGDLWKQPDLATTLTRIANHGRAGFYEGDTADLLVREMQRHGGLISLDDLKEYQSVWREPVVGTYRGHAVVSMPPPSSGGVLLIQMLNMIEPFAVRAMGYGSADVMHLMIEAERRAYADRAEYLGDPDFYPVPVGQLVDKGYARNRFSGFDPDQAGNSADVDAGAFAPESTETTHLSIMDRNGNAVALTTTLNSGYGSHIVVEGAGFILNNEMDDFSSKPNTLNQFNLIGREANAIEPRKRMLSSMTPTIVLRDGEPILVTGSPGGSTIITTVLQVVVNVIDHGMTLSAAVASPRFHHQWIPDSVTVEKDGFAPGTLDALRDKGHLDIRPQRYGLGDANSIMRVNGVLHGVEDPRTQGGAAGY